MKPIFSIFNFLKGLKTTKFHDVPSGTAVKMYGKDADDNLVEDDVPSGGGATAFTELSDVPSDYTDQAGKMLVVNDDEDALEFTDVTETHTHTNKDVLDSIIDSGDGDEFLADDGTYKAIETGLQYFSENRNTLSPNDTVPAHQLIPNGTESHIDLVLKPKGEGAILAQIQVAYAESFCRIH
ncbi:MAG TPA: hypothetical protein PKY56_11515 [Candidatus Kapabacteria bacterium]|nr:hypothetical protein [Candidatus Kapabacteria bacterium]